MIFDLIILDIMENISLIKNSKRIKQSMDFTSVQNRAIHPSDIDGILEFDDKYLFINYSNINNKIKIPLYYV